jgi:SAM-dependent methyltransferase
LSETYNFQRYLEAKKSVDDRALNRGVWQTLAQELPRGTPDQPVRILEVGCGIGTMVERMLEWGLFDFAEYTGLDAQTENIGGARRRHREWARSSGYRWEELVTGDYALQDQNQHLRVRLIAGDVFDYIGSPDRGGRPDLLVAHAVLDLLHIPTALPRLFELLGEGGLFYFTINFDGATLFEPPIDPELDGLIQRLYHLTMDERLTDGKPSGDSQAGRHLFQYIKQAGGQILSAGASDWVVFAGPEGYPYDEAYFLDYILNTVHCALQGRPELDAAPFADWIAQRHAQVEGGELVYIAHQLDFVGRRV